VKDLEETMSTTCHIRWTGILCCALIACIAPAQTAPKKRLQIPAPTAKEIADAMGRLEKGEPFLVDIAQLAQAGVVDAIPELKKQFAASQDEITREAVARALVKLGDKDPIYWDYLAREATVAVDSDEPFPSGFGADGKMAPGLSPQFTAWAKTHNLTTEAAADLATHDLPSKVMFLAWTGDRRAIPLLRRALSSPNFLIQEVGAEGLTDLQDKASIPFIIAACRNAPAEVASGLAEFLAEFDDTVAQRAAKEFPPPKEPR
jgi:hypothetical protein